MRGRENNGRPSGDFFCFSSRTHTTILPKPSPSPVTPSELAKRLSRHKKPVIICNHQSSPLKLPQTTSDLSEPSSPRVTCGGQIRMKARAVTTGSRKNWESVMEEMEKLHERKHKRKATWAESLGFKNDLMQFLTCLGRLKFGSLSNASAVGNITSDEERSSEGESYGCGPDGSSETTFSKWFTILQEQQKESFRIEQKGEVEDSGLSPPPSPMMLMRSRSVSAKSLLEDIQEKEEDKEDQGTIEKEAKDLVPEEEKRNENIEMMMRYDTEYYKLSSDIAEETWVIADSFSRDRSRKR